MDRHGQKENPPSQISGNDSRVCSSRRMQTLATLAGNSSALQAAGFCNSTVQRMKINGMETSNPADFGEIILYLYKKMKEDQLTHPGADNPAGDELAEIFKTLNNQLIPLTLNEQKLLLLLKEHFNVETVKIHSSHFEGGVWAKISLFINGRWVTDTGLYEGGEYTNHKDLFGDGTMESKLSKKDAEAQAIYEASETFPKFINTMKPEDLTGLNILFTTNIGPCDGCKQRVLNFLDYITSKCSLKKIPIDVIFIYSGDPCRTVYRKGTYETQYGYSGSTRITNTLNEKRGLY